jgi:hypothetical protein
MFTRSEILATLTGSQEKLFAHYQALTPEELEQVCTSSEVPDGTPWRVKDHLAHLVLIEHAFQRMIRHTLQGEADPVGFSRIGATNRQEILDWIHQQNQAYFEAHYDDSLEVILAEFVATRAESLALLARLTDEQLALPVPGAPWADGTIGGVLITNAGHATQHLGWVEAGLSQS